MIVFGIAGVMPQTGGGPSIPDLDLVLHFLGWIVGGVSGRWAYPRAREPLVGGGLWAYSLLIEIVQIFVPTRSFEVGDLVANGAGIVVGLLAMRLARGSA